MKSVYGLAIAFMLGAGVSAGAANWEQLHWAFVDGREPMPSEVICFEEGVKADWMCLLLEGGSHPRTARGWSFGQPMMVATSSCGDELNRKLDQALSTNRPFVSVVCEEELSY